MIALKEKLEYFIPKVFSFGCFIHKLILILVHFIEEIFPE